MSNRDHVVSKTIVDPPVIAIWWSSKLISENDVWTGTITSLMALGLASLAVSGERL